MTTFDRTDRDLISLLRSNARMSVVDLARKLGVSRATVQNRMVRLQKDQVLLGYTVRLGSDVEEAPVRSLMCLVVESKKEATVIRGLRGHPNVKVIHHTTGHWDLIAEICADSLDSFNQIVGELRLIDGVSTTETSLLLDSL